MSGYNAMEEEYDPVELLERPALFSCLRIDRATVPDGLYAYDIRHGDDDGIAVTVEKHVSVNHMGTVITAEPLDFDGQDHIPLMDENCGLNFSCEHGSSTISEFLQHLSDLRMEQGVEPEQSPGMILGM